MCIKDIYYLYPESINNRKVLVMRPLWQSLALLCTAHVVNRHTYQGSSPIEGRIDENETFLYKFTFLYKHVYILLFIINK